MKNLLRVVFSAWLLVALGCSKSSSSHSGDKDVKVSKNGDQVVLDLQGKDGEKVHIAASENGVELPPGFPKDLPIYPKAVVQMANSSGPNDTMVGTMVAATPNDALIFYQKELPQQGWKIENNMKAGEGYMVTITKGPRSGMIMISPQNAKETFIQLTITGH
jgi:hypothetical protein